MSASNSACSRRLSTGVSERGWKSQNRPWWQSTSCAPAAAAVSNSSSPADTPVTTSSTSVGAGHLEAVGPVVVEARGLEQVVEEGDELVAVRHVPERYQRITRGVPGAGESRGDLLRAYPGYSGRRYRSHATVEVYTR